MKIQDQCVLCVVNQTIKVADMAGIENKNEIFKKVFGYLSKVDFSAVSTPELLGEIFKLLKAETNNPDPYKETRAYYNSLFLEKLPALSSKIDQADDPFLQAVKYAIIGNIIDFSPVQDFTLLDIEEYFSRMSKEPLKINDSALLAKETKEAKNILYLGDNCGEICLDKLLIKKIKALNPNCRVTFATRGEPVVNDSVEEDAHLVGVDEYADIISNEDSSLGTVLSRTSKEFNELYRLADIVVAKGQGNYECLSGESKNIYFLLTTKCDVIAKALGLKQMQMICMKNRLHSPCVM